MSLIHEHRYWRCKVWLGVIFFLSVGDASAALYERPKERVPLPSPIGSVSDHAQVVDDAWKERIRSVCTDLEKKSGVEMVIVTPLLLMAHNIMLRRAIGFSLPSLPDGACDLNDTLDVVISTP